MFDDVKNNSVPTTPPTNQPPAGLPTSDESLGHNNPSPAQPEPSKPIVVEDMLAEADSGIQNPSPAQQPPTTTPLQQQNQTPPALIAKDSGQAMQTPPAAGGPPPEMPSWQDHDRGVGTKKKLLLIGIVVIVVLLVAIGGYIAYQQFFVGSNSLLAEPDVVEQAQEQELETTPAEVVPVGELGGADEGDAETGEVGQLPVDSDGDGLSDQEEAQYNTNPTLADSDRDGLFDREEVITWKTDPLNADSDGDSYSDGDEVRNGYDPLGPGTLEFYEYLEL